MVEVTDTAAAVARVRAAEGTLPEAERLFDDPYAHLFTGGAAADEAFERFLGVPFFRESMRVRTRFIDDDTRRALGDGMRDVVILGAGFDCRSLRLGELADAHVFEIDFAGQLAAKQQALGEAGIAIPPHLHFVPCDFAAPDFDAQLSHDLHAAGLRAGAPTLFIWEGVTSYLSDADIDRSLEWMARTGGPGSRLVFNYNLARFDAAGARARVLAAGFTTFADETLDVLYRRYLPGAPPPGGDLYHLAVAGR